MTERCRFITLHQEGLFSMSELCARFAISRKTGYKWLARFVAQGFPALADQSRAPHACPHRLAPAVEAALLAVKHAHPSWGPKKLLPYLRQRQPELPLPAPSTVGDLLQRQGLTQPRRRRRRGPHPGALPLTTTAPNQVWGADFKGQFPTRDGSLCYPLTVTDAHSRYLLACQALPSTATAGVQPCFQRLFAEYGLPEAIRTDNGPPFASTGWGGLTQLAVSWIKLGITPQRITPGKPQQNGRHERMHRTLKAETARPPARTLAAQQARFAAFRIEFNEERPHEALDQVTPATAYHPSPRPLPRRVGPPEYPGHYRVRKVGSNGTFRLASHRLFLSFALCNEDIGLEEIDDGVWSVYFYQVPLARFSERDYRLVG